MSLSVYYPIARATLHVIFDGFGDTSKDSAIQIIHTLPKAATIHRNGYHLADSWELTLDANDLPLDPQLVRSAMAEIRLYQQPADQHDQRVISRQFAMVDDPSSVSGTDSLDSLRRETSQSARALSDNEPMIVGLFDQQDMEFSDDGKWITISGQDYTALLAGKQWPPTANHTARKIPVGKRLDYQLRDLLAEADDQGVLQFVVDKSVGASDLPIVGAKEANGNKRGIAVEESTSYWDVMYKLALRHGFILYVQGADVILANPKNIDAAAPARPKALAWGRNLQSLRLTRHLGKVKVPRIVVQGYDPVARANIRAEYPNTGFGKHVSSKIGTVGFKPSSKATHIEKQSKATAGKTGSKTTPTIKEEDEFELQIVHGAVDHATLQALAETMYHLRGHSERKLVAVTHDMNDMRQSSLLNLAAGDPVTVEWDDFNREMIANPGVPAQAKKQHLISRGFNAEVAQIIAENYQLLLSQDRPMRVREVTYEYDADEGITIEVELQDFVVAGGNRDSSRRPTVDRLQVIG